MAWFSVRHVVHLRSGYEERITLWQRDTADQAIEAAEAEAAQYAAVFQDAKPLSIYQSYELADDLRDGGECFSLIRESDLGPEDYIDRFFDTGSERQQRS